MEYVDWCCEETRGNLANAGIPGDVIHADLFDYQLESDEQGWDVVCSFGLVEHFSDTREVVQKHLDLVRPGGLIALTIPNHSGINGPLMKVINRKQHAAHNLMSYEDLEAGVIATENADVVAGGYLGRLGFWNVGLYPRIAGTGYAYPLLRAPFYLAEKAGRILPNTKLFSPNAAIIARKRSD
jgi:SAM-dependent methyltransferase